MKWPRPRFTLRRSMIAVALIALSLGAIRWVVEMRFRSFAFQLRAFEFEVETMRSGSNVLTPDGRFVSRYDNENNYINDAWALEMASKYHRLSAYPWLPVEPDPPRPKPLAHPRRAIDLPADFRPERPALDDPPAWTFLWTWRRW